MNIDISEIKVTKVKYSRISEVDFNNIKFGRQFADHMFSLDYADGEWKNPEIKPYQNLSFSPAMSALHYGQAVFEGLKAYKENGEVFLFRANDNLNRMNKSAKRMCIPEIPLDIVKQALNELVKIDSNWIPEGEESSLYIRPFIFATDEYVGIKPSDTYKLIIFTCPVGSYYSEPLKVKIETEYTRAADGGVGQAKAAGNYAASLYPAKKAKEEGYHQLIWTDSKEHKYIEESGTMNVIFVIDDVIITPNLSNSILPGITRDSVLQIGREWGYKVEERPVAVKEVIDAAKNGTLQEAFGAGTAATIAQIDVISSEGIDYKLPSIPERKFSNKVYTFLNRLKKGKEEDKWGWVEKL
jgi:branched-chain amino acid aminotransferase